MQGERDPASKITQKEIDDKRSENMLLRRAIDDLMTLGCEGQVSSLKRRWRRIEAISHRTISDIRDDADRLRPARQSHAVFNP